MLQTPDSSTLSNLLVQNFRKTHSVFDIGRRDNAWQFMFRLKFSAVHADSTAGAAGTTSKSQKSQTKRSKPGAEFDL